MLIFWAIFKQQISRQRVWGRGQKNVVFATKNFLFSAFWLLLFTFSSAATDLNRQLDIRINNGTQGQARDEADRLIRLGGQYRSQGNLDKAIPNWLRALTIYQEIGDFQSIGRTYDFLGLAYAELGFYKEAEDALRRRLGLARTNKDIQGQIFGLNNLGTILLRRGSLPAAKATFEEALEIARLANNAAGQGLSLNNLGLVATGQRDYDRAIKQYEAAVILRRRGGDAVGEANTYNNLGDAYCAIGRYRDSIGPYGAALRIARDSRDRPNQFRAIDGLVTIYNLTGPRNRALDLLQQRLHLAREIENRSEELKSLLSLAHYYQQSDNAEAYRSFYRQAVTLERNLKGDRTYD